MSFWESFVNLRWIWIEGDIWLSLALIKIILWFIAKLWMICKPWRWIKVMVSWQRGFNGKIGIRQLVCQKDQKREPELGGQQHMCCLSYVSTLKGKTLGHILLASCQRCECHFPGQTFSAFTSTAFLIATNTSILPLWCWTQVTSQSFWSHMYPRLYHRIPLDWCFQSLPHCQNGRALDEHDHCNSAKCRSFDLM